MAVRRKRCPTDAKDIRRPEHTPEEQPPTTSAQLEVDRLACAFELCKDHLANIRRKISEDRNRDLEFLRERESSLKGELRQLLLKIRPFERKGIFPRKMNESEFVDGTPQTDSVAQTLTDTPCLRRPC